MSDSPAVILYDSEGNPVAVRGNGTTRFLAVEDPEQGQLLKRILEKLSNIDRHLATMTDEEFDEREDNAN